MIRRLPLLLVLCLAWPAQAEEDGAHDVGVAWFPHVRDALVAAKQTGRPLWVAVHARPAVGAEVWPHHVGAWSRMYRDPQVVRASRTFACALLMKWNVPAEQLSGSPMHLVLDDRGRIVHQTRGWTTDQGPATRDALLAFLREGERKFGPIAADAPVIDAARVAAGTPASADTRKPIGLGSGAPGLALRLRFELPAPATAQSEPLVAQAQMTWDGHGPFDLELVRFEPGQMIDQRIEVRFGDHPGLQGFLTPGDHELVLWLAPVPGKTPFAEGPVRVGHAKVRMGDGGGGGDSNQPPPPDPPPGQQPPPPDQQPPPDTQEPEPPKQDPPPKPPEQQRVEIVEPNIDSDDLVRKEDAVVAVPDPQGGTKPPKPVPLEDAAPALRRARDQATRDSTLHEADRSFLRRYFEVLEKMAKRRPK